MALTIPVFGQLNSAGLQSAPIQQTTSYTTNGFTCDINETQFPLQLGVPLQNNYTFSVIPAATNQGGPGAAAAAQCVVNTHTLPGGAGAVSLPLVTANQVNPGGTAVPIFTYAVQYNGNPAVIMDCERCLEFTFSGNTTAASVMTLQALDYRGTPMTIVQNFALGASLYTLNNPVSVILSISFSVNPLPGGTVAVGNSPFIGLPYFLSSPGCVISLTYGGISTIQPRVVVDGASLVPVGGNTTVAVAGALPNGVTAGTPWRSLTAAQINNPVYMSQTYMISPTRGFVIAGGDFVGCDGNSALIVNYFVYGSDSETNANIQNLNPSAISLYNVKNTATGAPALPYLTQADLVGAQWNSNPLTGDVPFLTGYANLLNT